MSRQNGGKLKKVKQKKVDISAATAEKVLTNKPQVMTSTSSMPSLTDQKDDVDDVDFPYLANNPFPTFEETHQMFNFDESLAYSETQPMNFAGPVRQALQEAKELEEDKGISEDSGQSQPQFQSRPLANKKPMTPLVAPSGWIPPMVPASAYCLNNRLDNAATALSSLLFHLDLALEEYPNSHPSDQKHFELCRELQRNVLKVRQMDRQFLKCKKEIKRILDLDYV